MILFVLACGVAIEPVAVRAPEPAPPPIGLAQVYAIPEEGTLFPAPRPPGATPPLAPGDGRDVVMGYCSACHNTTYITMQPPLPAERWSAIIDKMVAAYGAQVPEAEKAKLTSYLGRYYGPERR